MQNLVLCIFGYGVAVGSVISAKEGFGDDKHTGIRDCVGSQQNQAEENRTKAASMPTLIAWLDF